MSRIRTVFFPNGYVSKVLYNNKVRKTMNRALPEYSENHDESKKRKMTFAKGRLLKSSDREEVKNRQ
uniref:Uncharacterized protein n=1 Tax=Caenorhabditis japonica TaxID=281687 RepID=A0A8R1IBX3_CAEJA